MADIDPDSIPFVPPVEVALTKADSGRPTTAFHDWLMGLWSWMKNTVVALDYKLTTVESTTNGNTASITTEIQARTDADNALASQITTVSTTVGDNTAEIAELLVSVNGLGVQWAVQGYVNGVTGGLVFTGLRRADGIGADYLLEITSNVIINGNLLVTGSILNEGLSNSAVSRAWANEGASSATITPDFRGTGFLEIYAQFKGDGNAYPAIDQFVLRVSEDGNLLADTPINHAQNGTGSSAASRYGSTSIVYIRTPSAGVHTYTAEIVKVIGATPITISGCLIVAKEFSK